MGFGFGLGAPAAHHDENPPPFFRFIDFLDGLAVRALAKLKPLQEVIKQATHPQGLEEGLVVHRQLDQLEVLRAVGVLA